MKLYKALIPLAVAGYCFLTPSCNYLDVDGYFDDTLKYDSVFVKRQYLEKYLWGAAGEPSR